MTLQKAIKILSHSADGGVTTFNEDFKDAEELGIEALKQLIKMRLDNKAPGAWALPGETED